MNTLFAFKLEMTSDYTESGNRVGVTILTVPETSVSDIRTPEKHGYSALRLKIQHARFKRKSVFREVRTEEAIESGKPLTIDEVFKVGDVLKISGTTKGKGFTGVVKRHNFRGGPRTHGTSDRERAPGSSGTNMTPGRVFKGKRRAGHMGNDTAAIMGSKILSIDSEKRLIRVIGSVPGSRKGEILTLTKL